VVHTAWRVFLYALVAATSPLALTSTLMVLRSGRGRVNGTLYAIAFVTAQTLVLALAVALGVATSGTSGDGHPTLQALFALVFGVALLATAGYVRAQPTVRASPDREGVRRPSRVEAALSGRIEHLGPGQALGIGIALGVGGPKRIGITVLVAGTIAAADVGAGAGLMIGVSYIVVGTLLVWLPVVLYVVAGQRATEWITTAQRWAAAHQRTLTFYPTLVVGTLLVVDALVQLL
jgi:hypothetical protein